MRIGFRIPSLAKRIAARTSIKRFVRHNLGVKAPRGLGWITNPKKALYNRIYSRTTRGCMIYLIILMTGLVWLLAACDFQPKKERAGKSTYVRPSVDSRGRVRKGYVRIPVSANKKLFVIRGSRSITMRLGGSIEENELQIRHKRIYEIFFQSIPLYI
jgi:hypothetical protein